MKINSKKLKLGMQKSEKEKPPKPQMKKSFPLGKVYQLLEPGPVVLVTSNIKNKANIMTMSWHTMMEFEPPLIGCIISNRNFSFEIIKKTKMCGINIPTVQLAKKVVACGNTTGRELDKFQKFKLTPVVASQINVPLVNECFAQLECKVVDAKMMNKYNFFVLQVVKVWVDPKVKSPKTIHHQGNGIFMVAGKSIQIPSKMK